MSAAPHISSDVDPVVFLVLFGVLAVATVALAARTRDPVALLVCLGALVCALNEPIYDWLGKIVYADDATRAYTAFGRDIPLFLVIGYVPWVGGLPYLIARGLRAGWSRSRLHWIAFGSFASVVVIETLGTSLQVWDYYGQPPLRDLGVAPMMAPVPIVCGALIFLLDSVLEGRSRLLIGVVPVFALPAVYAATGMPLYVALHSDVSKLVQYLAGAATLLFCALVVAATTLLTSRLKAT